MQSDTYRALNTLHSPLRSEPDSSATPTVGQRPKTLGQLTPVDIERLWTRIAATIEKTKADDPRELRKRIVALHGAALRTQVRQLTPKYDDIVIDVGGRDTGSLRAALTVANTVLIPVQPRSFDIWAVGQIAELVREAREINDALRALVVLNAADPQGHDNEEAAEVIREVDGLQLLDQQIGRRKAFPNAASAGRSVTEYTPRDPKACDEMQAVISTVYAE